MTNICLVSSASLWIEKELTCKVYGNVWKIAMGSEPWEVSVKKKEDEAFGKEWVGEYLPIILMVAIAGAEQSRSEDSWD